MKLLYFAAALLLTLCANADAQIQGVPCISGCTGSLQTNTYTGYVYVAGYYAESDGGEGELHLETCSPVDNGSCIQGVGSATWKRLNLDGSVEQFGAIPALSGDNATNNSYNAFVSAFLAAKTAGLGTVYVKGNQNGSRYYLYDNLDAGPALTIPPGMKLQCLSAPPGQSENNGGKSTGDYNSIPFTLILPQPPLVTNYSTIQLGQAAQFQGCEVQQAGLATPPSGTATYRNLMNGTTGMGGVASMAGTAITFGANGDGTGDNAEVRDTTIIGFNTGIYSNKNSDIKISNVMDDSTRCADLKNVSFGVATINDFYCYPLLTRNISHAGGPVEQQSFFLGNIAANGSNGYTVTLCATAPCVACTPGNNCPQATDIIWITNPQGAESTEGRWTLSNCTGTPLSCDLNGSNSLSVGWTGTYNKGVTQIQGAPPNAASITATGDGAAFGYSTQNYLIELTLSTTTPPADGQIVSVTGFTVNDTPEANGVWRVINSTAGSSSSTIDLENSVIQSPCSGTCPGGAKVEWGYPSAGQTVSGTGIASATTVSRVWPAADTVFLSKSTTASGSNPGFSDNSFPTGGTAVSGAVASGGSSPCPTYSSNDICITVASTSDLPGSGNAEIAVQNVDMNTGSTTPINSIWNGVYVMDATHLDIPYIGNQQTCSNSPPCFHALTRAVPAQRGIIYNRSG